MGFFLKVEYFSNSQNHIKYAGAEKDQIQIVIFLG